MPRVKTRHYGEPRRASGYIRRMSDLVSIVVPTYNGVAFLSHTLDSLAAQTYDRIEVVVVDDGSSDSSATVAREHPVVSLVVEQPNYGVAVARNRGMAECHGSWVAFVDQDDLWGRDRTARLLELARITGSRAVATTEVGFATQSDRAALERVGDGREHWPEYWIEDGAERELVDRLTPVHPSRSDISSSRLQQGAATVTTAMLYERTLAISAGGCAPHARAHDDYVLAVNATRLNGGVIPRVDSGDLYYRVHSRSTTVTSPLVASFLATAAALRLGQLLDYQVDPGPNTDHLLWGLAGAQATAIEQLALLALTVPAGSRRRWLLRWAARRAHLR